MTSKFALVTSLLLAYAGLAQAQSTTICTCDSSAVRVDSGTLTGLLTNKMVCGKIGSEVWQEWHNGGAVGQLVDYKKGPGDPVDPSAVVGSYVVNGDNTVSYSYPVPPTATYKYDVCLVSSTNSYTFCGANYGGRNVVGVRIGGAGPTSCSGVSNITVLSTVDKRTPVKKPPVSVPATRAP
jgi:hypothetical protein